MIPAALLQGNEATEITGAVQGSVPRPWMTRGPRECAWPIDIEGAQHSCCAQRWGRSPYCQPHHQISTKAETKA